MFFKHKEVLQIFDLYRMCPFWKNEGLFLALEGIGDLAENESRASRSHSPTRSAFRESQMLQLKSSYPASKRRPLREKATEVIPQMMLS